MMLNDVRGFAPPQEGCELEEMEKFYREMDEMIQDILREKTN